MNQPSVSIIVPCYNQGQYLAEALDSVLSSTFQDWECIIVNDGSTDNSADVATTFVERDSRFKLLHQHNSGPSAARNRGVHESSGEFILFLDGDDKIEPEYIGSGISFLQKHADCTLFYCKARTFGSEEKINNWNYTTYRNLLRYNSIHCCSIIRRKDFDRIGGFDENMRGYEDWEMFIRLLYHNDFVCQSEKILFNYRIHRHEGSVNLQAIRRSKEIMEYIYNKNRAIYDEYFGSPIHSIRQAYYLQQEMDKLLASQKYRIGSFMANPWRMVKKWFKG